MSYQEDLLMLGQRDASLLSDSEIKTKIEQTITKTFARMAWLLLLAFGTARGISTGMIQIPFTSTGYLISAIGWFALIILISRRRQRMNYQTVAGLLLLFAVLEGYGLTGVFQMYALGSIYQVFLTTSILFGALAIAGNYLKIDVTRVGSILMISLIALLIGSVINMFRWNATFDIWISVFGVIIFSGFIIYDMQILKQQALVADDRVPLLISLWLFLNFINIFLFLLRIMGRRD